MSDAHTPCLLEGLKIAEPPVQNDHVLLLTFVVVTTLALLRGFRKPPNMFVKGAKKRHVLSKIIVIVISFHNAKWACIG